jgi:hypothetical protein
MIRLPYNLQEGQVAYAAKVMADFNAILTALNNLSAEGFSTQDISGMIADLADAINHKVEAGEPGNATDIKFTDGDTLQTKLDSGDLNGTDGVAAILDGCAAFDVDENGHLIVATNSGNPYSIVNGELIYTVPDPEGADYIEYDLGSVRGPSGEVTTSAMNSAISAALNGLGTVTTATAYALDWDDVNEIACNGVTTSNIILISPALSATGEERDAFRAAQIYPVSQGLDAFILGYDGLKPDIDIPLQVVILNV